MLDGVNRGLRGGLFAVVLGALITGPATAGDGLERDQPLAEALRSLEREGVRLVFSDRLVPPDLRVVTTPRATTPAARLEELLRPHGLEARAAGGTWVVVRAPSPRFFTGEPIVVQAEREDRLGEAIDREAPDAALAAGDLLRAAAGAPGFAAEAGSAALDAGGVAPTVVIDGHELAEPLHLRPLGGPRSVFAGSTIAAARLVADPGPGRAQGGPVLELVTALPQTLRFHAEQARDGHDLGSAGRRRRLGWLAAWREAEPEPLETVPADARPPQARDGTAKLALDLGPARTLEVSGLAAQSRYSVGTFSLETADQLTTTSEGLDVWARYDVVRGPRVRVETRADWSELERSRLGVEIAESDGFAIRDRRRLREHGLAQDWRLRLGERAEVELGASLAESRATLEYADLFEVYRPGLARPGLARQSLDAPTPGVRTFDGEVRGERFVAYGQARVALRPGLRFDFGLRHERAGWVDDDGAWSSRLGLVAELGGGVLEVSVARSHRFARPLDLRVEDGETTFPGAERADRVAVGYGRRFARIGLRLDAWRRETEDPWPRFENRLRPPGPFPEIEDDRVGFQPESRTAAGASVVVDGRVGGSLGWRASYAWGRAVDRLGDRAVPLRFDQAHALRLALDLQAPGSIDLHLRWGWRSGWPTSSPDDPEALFDRRLPSSSSLDLGAVRAWSFRGWSVALHAEVTDLLDRPAARGVEPGDGDAVTLFGPGRRWGAGLRLSY